MNDIVILDAPCGTGKTNWAIQHMKSAPETSFIYCTPFLSEIERIRTECGERRFYEPYNFNMRKIDDFNRLLSEGFDIAVTHSTFLHATPETLELIREGEYILILDEALDVVEEFNHTDGVKDSPTQGIKSDDVKWLFDNKLIEADSDYKVKWVATDSGDSKYSEVERLADLGVLYCAGHEMLISIFSPEIFRCFKKIYVMTYLFGGSTLKYYFDLFGISYSLASVNHNDDGYTIIPYDAEIDRNFRQRCRDLITICNNDRLNDSYRNNSFSKNWYDVNMKTQEAARRLKLDLPYYFRRIAGARACDILWTCPETYKDKVKGGGYTCIRQLTSDERKLPESKRKKIEKENTCFTPLNARATNEYKDRWALAYCYNMYFHPMIGRFFRDRGVEINGDLFSLSCLIQWMFRSRIRNKEEIIIYLPSPRMRRLLQKWLNCEI